MSSREQKDYFSILKRYERKFEPREMDDYKMLAKRHKDDEDLDKISMQRLKNLFEKYHVNRERKNFDHVFNSPAENSENHNS
jgi:hypothetical protein